MKHLKTASGIGLLVLLMNCTPTEQPKELPIAFKQLENHNLSEADLEEKLEKLDPAIVENTDFWLSMVNDSSYSIYHRSAGAMMLFERHAKRGMLLTDFPAVFTSLHKGKHIVFQFPTKLERRKLRLSGGSWKDFGYYMSFNELAETDAVFRKFTETVSTQNGQIFLIELFSGTYFNMRRPPYVCTILCLGLSGQITESQLEEYLKTGKNSGFKNVRMIDLYLYRDKGITIKRENESDL